VARQSSDEVPTSQAEVSPAFGRGLRGEYNDAGEMRREPIEVRRILVMTIASPSAAVAITMAPSESCVNVLHSPECHTCGLGSRDPRDDLGRNQNLFADVASPTRPFRHDREWDENDEGRQITAVIRVRKTAQCLFPALPRPT